MSVISTGLIPDFEDHDGFRESEWVRKNIVRSTARQNSRKNE